MSSVKNKENFKDENVTYFPHSLLELQLKIQWAKGKPDLKTKSGLEKVKKADLKSYKI